MVKGLPVVSAALSGQWCPVSEEVTSSEDLSRIGAGLSRFQGQPGQGTDALGSGGDDAGEGCIVARCARTRGVRGGAYEWSNECAKRHSRIGL